MNVLTIAYIAEGRTDERFLGGIIKRTFESLLLIETDALIDVYDPLYLGKATLDTIPDLLEKVEGYLVLCVHTDADKAKADMAFKQRIEPIFKAIRAKNKNIKLVAVVPVYMTESWMLADKETLKKELFTDKNNTELGLNTAVETINNPKERIEEAIKIIDRDLPLKERNQVKIGELYTPLGQQIKLTALERLSSYQVFKTAVRNSLIALNFIKKNK